MGRPIPSNAFNAEENHRDKAQCWKSRPLGAPAARPVSDRLCRDGEIGPWGYIGIVLVLTAVVAYCPLYSVFGFSTTSR
jgi:hypothetical protein